MTGPAELVTCDQTIERCIARLKQPHAVYGMQASIVETSSVAALLRWFIEREDRNRWHPVHL
jgi:rubrerythrin